MAAEEAEKNKQAVRQIHQVLTGGDLAAAWTVLSKLFDPDVVVYEPASLPNGGVYHGRDEFLTMMGAFMAEYVDVARIQLHTIVADGDQVVIRWRYPWRPSPADEYVDVEVSEWMVFRDGKIIEAKPFYWDTAQLVRPTA